MSDTINARYSTSASVVCCESEHAHGARSFVHEVRLQWSSRLRVVQCRVAPAFCTSVNGAADLGVSATWVSAVVHTCNDNMVFRCTGLRVHRQCGTFRVICSYNSATNTTVVTVSFFVKAWVRCRRCNRVDSRIAHTTPIASRYDRSSSPA
jgi:hypothetical protein